MWPTVRSPHGKAVMSDVSNSSGRESLPPLLPQVYFLRSKKTGSWTAQGEGNSRNMIEESPGACLWKRWKQQLRQEKWKILPLALTEYLAWSSAEIETGNLMGDSWGELETGFLKTHLMWPAKWGLINSMVNKKENNKNPTF